MRFDLLLLLLLGTSFATSSFALPDLSRSVYLPHLSLLPLVFSRLDSFL
jgi:hypothetical protein